MGGTSKIALPQETQAIDLGCVPAVNRLETFLETKSLRLLLVEDDNADAILACNLVLESMPEYLWDIQVAPTMTKAIDMLSSQNFHLAIVDLGLQDVEGPETVDVLCMVDPALPIVVFSGTVNDHILQGALQRGAFICMHKDDTSAQTMRTALINALSKNAVKQ